MKRSGWLTSTVLAVVLYSGVSAADERWLLNGAGSFAGPFNDPYDSRFGTGAVGDLGGYRSLAPAVLIGARVSAGVLSHDETAVVNSGDFGMGALSATLRLRPFGKRSDPRRGTGLWLEAAGGPGIMESEVRAVLSPGLGYAFDVGGFGLGPVARYVQVIETGDQFNGRDARLGTIGLELLFLDAPGPEKEVDVDTRGQEFQPAPPPLQPAARVEPTGPSDIDRDGIMDSADKCPREPETANGMNDNDGCPDDKVEFVDDRLVLGEHVMFNFDSATLLESGQEKMKELVDVFRRTGAEWKTLTVMGFTDDRGSQEYNEDLGARRAEAVKRYLVSLDVPEDKINIESFGELKPVVPDATTEEQHRKNRRVEFVIAR